MYSEIAAFTHQHHVTLVAVSKTQPVEAIQALYDMGQRDFGENKVQEMTEKQTQLPDDIRWHLIGHLQKNKVKYIAPFVHMIHAVESTELLTTIQQQALKHNSQIKVLLQFHIADEDTKYGMNLEEAIQLIENVRAIPFPNIILSGVMGMATFTENMEQVRKEFRHLKNIFDTIKSQFFPNDDAFCHISMGMSGDYPIAIAEGATMVRIGSAIFGARN